MHRARLLYGKWIGPGDLCFDIGANVGERARIFLALGGRVVAVEPQPACAAVLRAIPRERLVVEEVALGPEPGSAKLRVADATTISSMAEGWIEQVRRAGRFGGLEWHETIEVQVTTLDALIRRHGVPVFCKIDVEGYEVEVLAGLSRPLTCLSFEFTPEWSDAAEAAMARLEGLGFSEFNFSVGESLRLLWHDWRDGSVLRAYLDSAPRDGLFFGDVYARSGEPRPRSGAYWS